jgi:protein-tyrosine phosphatase
MACTIYTVEIEGKAKLGYMARPRGGDWLEDELVSVSKQHFDVIVSLLQDEEASELDLNDESTLCARRGLQFFSIPISDRGVPAFDDATMAALSSLRRLWRHGQAIVTHCRMGYGRAPMIAACIMVSKERGGEEAFEKLSAARGISVPETDEQRAWVQKYAKIVARITDAS